MSSLSVRLPTNGYQILASSKGNQRRRDVSSRSLVPTFPITVAHPSIGTSMKLHVPVKTVDEETNKTSSPSYTDYLKGYLEYKRKAQPWLTEVETMKCAIRELKSMQLGYPGFQDEATVRCLTCYFDYLCDLDTMLEMLPIEEAKQCAQNCLSMLDGQKGKDPDIDTALGKAQTMTTAFRDTVIRLLPPAAAKATLASTRAMIAGQLPERVFLESKAPFPDIHTYLRLREQPFGLLPHVAMVEHYFMPGGAERRADVDLIAKQVVHVAILQNDVGNLEKDIKNNNLSNTILVLAELAGRPIREAADVPERQDILRQAETLHDDLVQQVIVTFLRIQRHAVSEGEIRFSRVMLDLCRRQLQWTAQTPKYDINCQ